MRTLSLDLRGFGSEALPRPAQGRAASLSLLLHGAGIATLIVAPLLQAGPTPNAASSAKSFLAPPNLAPPPSLPPAGSRGVKSASATPKKEPAPENLADPLRNTFVSLGEVPDLAVDFRGEGDAAGPGGTLDFRVGDCPLGSLCGKSHPIAESTPHDTPRVGGLIREPRLLSADAPRYPPIAVAAGASGRVILEALVGRDGRVVDCRILDSHPLFDDAAMASVRSRRYEPLLLNGVPTDFLVRVTVRFSLAR